MLDPTALSLLIVHDREQRLVSMREPSPAPDTAPRADIRRSLAALLRSLAERLEPRHAETPRGSADPAIA